MEQARTKEQRNTVADHPHGADSRIGETCWLIRDNSTGRQTQAREKHNGKIPDDAVRRIARENAWQIGR